MTTVTQPLPHWDLTTVYPGLDSHQFEEGFNAAVARIADLATLFDRHGVGARPGSSGAGTAAPDDATAPAFDEVVERFNAVLTEIGTLGAYIRAHVATNSRDDRAQAQLSALQRHTVLLSQLDTRLTAWIGALDIAALAGRSETARTHAYALERARVEAAHQMAPGEEALAAELGPSGGTAWGKLHGNWTSQQMVRLIGPDGAAEDLPMSMVRNRAYDADRAARRRAYEAELAAWERAALPLAAALNSIKGQVDTLSTRRGWVSPLDAALFENSIDRATLDAMMEAARASFPDFRRYLRAKARALGASALAWYDLFAPVGRAERAWGYDEGAHFISETFGSYAPGMRDLADRAFRESWIDAEPRPGKRDGAFCMQLRGEESRILSNYSPTFEGVSTLAHELGHAYHNLNLAGRTPLQRSTPMTLAETASIFCETIIRQAGLAAAASDEERLGLLEVSLQGTCQVVVDITSRFLFESRVFAARRERELSIADFNELMLGAQRETYGDGLDESFLHPYMWAVKGHYYDAHRSFYNYPYMFGQLFGLGLYARYQDDPDRFVAGYDDLLSSTGLADAATLAARFGIDIRTPAFWHDSLDIVRADIDRFEGLVDRASPRGIGRAQPMNAEGGTYDEQ